LKNSNDNLIEKFTAAYQPANSIFKLAQLDNSKAA
jgi:hypothetical protein